MWTGRRRAPTALGLNGLYLNLRGRESERHRRYRERRPTRLMAEIRGKLLAVQDPKSKQQVITRIDLASEAYQGPYARSGPDMLVGYNRGYRAGWQTILGAFPPDELEDNSNPWSGDHCMDYTLVPGVLLSNRKICGEFARANRYRSDDSRGVWNRQGARYDWTIRVSARRDPLSS